MTKGKDVVNLILPLCFSETPPAILLPALGSPAQGHCPLGASLGGTPGWLEAGKV